MFKPGWTLIAFSVSSSLRPVGSRRWISTPRGAAAEQHAGCNGETIVSKQICVKSAKQPIEPGCASSDGWSRGFLRVQACGSHNCRQKARIGEGEERHCARVLLIRPDHSPKQIARGDGQEVVGHQRCASKHAKVSKKGAKAVLETRTTNEENEPRT